mmetsp:Transcript_32082/g.47038  ORF Transcript_32082/g.47038 Transcript_32082/m.47038 type:complete len:413 (+) Transcript_32082:72-1310(+)
MATETDPLIAENGESKEVKDYVPNAKPIRRVHFDGSSHISVIFQIYGSVWPKVLPYCLFNVLLSYAIHIVKLEYGIDLSIEGNNASFMSILVSFLVVTRAKIAYARFMEARGNLQTMYRVVREIIQHVCILTQHSKSEGAKAWRRDVAYQTIALLRVTMATLEYKSSKKSSWNFFTRGKKRMRKQMLKSVNYSGTSVRNRMMNWAHTDLSLTDENENFRAPILLAYALRAELLSQRSGERIKTRRVDTKTPVHPNEEKYLLAYVDAFVTSYHNLKKLASTPFPFPLVQMGRTFLFVYTYTLPFALAHSMHHPLGAMLMIFFITYGYLGLEYVAMELDDPFGDDPNDFDDLGLARVVFEDIYMNIYKVDGKESLHILRHQVAERLEKSGALEDLRSSICKDMMHTSLDVLSAS